MNQEEKQQSKLLVNYIRQERKYFEYADVSQYLLEEQKDDDLLLLQSSLMDWIEKLKQEDPRKNELTLLLKSVWRIQSYCGTLETVCRASTVKVVELERRVNHLKSEVKLSKLENIQEKSRYDKELKSLKSENEFLSK